MNAISEIVMPWPFGDLVAGSFDTIVADPPWYFHGHTDAISKRDARHHYDVMSKADIMALPVRSLAARDAHLFLWTTGPCLPQAFEVMRAWGFRYSAIAFTWVKLKRSFEANQLRILPTQEQDLFVGLGFTTRKNSEICLLGRRGNAKRHAKNVREIILSPVREHSRKPEEARERIEAYVGKQARIIELFARSSRAGWASWGNEVGKFEPAAA